jgi:SAM-dependent methyltransferase
VARLIDDSALEHSSVVANRAMNRERDLTGSNGYGRELGIDIPALITEGPAPFRWLDLCCGTGKALLQCASQFDPGRLHITGVDLVDFYAAPPSPAVRFITASITDWQPDQAAFDLITCVHGLHYIGDKLRVLAQVATWLAPAGRFAANLDLTSIRTPGNRRLASALRAAGFTIDARRRRITRTGPATLALPFTYLGADDTAGPNYTGQPAVHSHYT